MPVKESSEKMEYKNVLDTIAFGEVKEVGNKYLTSSNVAKIFDKCVVSNDDMTKGEIITIETGSNPIHLYIEKVKQLSLYISQLMMELPEIFRPINYLSLVYNKWGQSWIEKRDDIFCLVALGIANGNLKYYKEKKEWNSLPLGFPHIVRSDYCMEKGPGIEWPIQYCLK